MTFLNKQRLYQVKRSTDWGLFAIVLLLAFLGLLNLFSAVDGRAYHHLLVRQIIWTLIGLTLYMVISHIDYRILNRFSWILLVLVTFVIFSVELIGMSTKGSQRWLDLGYFSIQPSEFAKIAVIIAMAQLTQEMDGSQRSLKHIGLRIGLIGLPMVLVLFQPDLGSASLIYLIVISMAFLVLKKWWILVLVLGVQLMLLPVFWFFMHSYQKARVLAFLDPSIDPTGMSWQTIQSITAIGAGRGFGQGYLEGTQNRLKFLPEQWTDFPFSVWAEEWGFVGCIVLLSLFLILLVRIMIISTKARDSFGAVLCIGVAALIFWHIIVNVAMVIGLAPVVGVTLPFFSYGGSSLITLYVGLGLVSSTYSWRHLSGMAPSLI